MLKGYTAPRTPKGTSSLAPFPPWHYVGNCLAVEYEANPDAVMSLMPSSTYSTTLTWSFPICDPPGSSQAIGSLAP